MNGTDEELHPAAGGSYWKGVAIGLGCQVAYLMFVASLGSSEMRLIGYVLFALVQFLYLYPLAAYYQRQRQELTSNGLMLVGVVSLIVAAVWFVYAILHGTFSAITGI